MYLLTITSVFLSTPSARRATFVPSRLLWEHFEFLSTPSARRATGFGAQTPSGGYDFYPRPPRGGRQDSETNGFRIIKFLSTPSARRATRTRRQMVSGSSNFYPRPPRGGRPSTPGFATLSYNFYPRPPRGGRQDSETNGFRIIKFLSTPSARRATKTPKQEKSTKVISIHALREEGDGTRRPMVPKPSNFYPRPPRGGRPKATEAAEAKEYFYPRPPRGGRRTTPRYSNITKNFYPRPPRGGRPKYGAWATSS